jgi:uncharacterized protein YceK
MARGGRRNRRRPAQAGAEILTEAELQLPGDPGKVAPDSGGRAFMRFAISMAMAALLAGCSWFTTTHSWSKPGTTEEQAKADLDACKKVAWSERETDAKIDQDTSAVMNDNGQGAVDTELSQNMSNQREGKRFDDIVDDCMRQLGYGPAQ